MTINQTLKTESGFVLHSIQRTTIILITGTLLGNVLSFIKSLIIAKYYGTSGELDAYFLSLAPFELISGILVGAVHAILVPRYLELLAKKGKPYAFAVFGTYALWLLFLVMIIALVFLIGSSLLASYLGTGFDAYRVDLTAALLKISTFLLVLTVLNDTGVCLFHAHRQFTFPAFVPLLSAILSLGYIVYFRSQGVFSLIYGLVVGMLLQTGVTLLATKRFFPEKVFLLPPFNPDSTRTLTLMLPLLNGSSFGHINVVVDQITASVLPAGSIAALNYANRLHSILTQMFIMVIARAVLPFFARQVADNDIEALKATFFLTIKRMLYVLLPMSVLILVLGKPMVQLVFQRGAFTASSTSATAGAWIAYTLGLPAQAVGILTARIYNAFQDNKTLMYVAGGGMGVNIFLNWTFMHVWGHIGIALSTSGVSWVTTAILLYRLRKKIHKRSYAK